MSTDNRSVATDALATLGTCPIPEGSGRDAIHIAVEPVVAGEKLYPGQDVALSGGRAVGTGELVGIVDPFLKGPVQNEELFWLFVYPRQITSLRHVWSHPKFLDEQATWPAPMTVSADTQDALKALSEAWLHDFCNSDYGRPSYGKLLEEAADFEGWEEYLTIHGQSAGGDIPDEMWDHLEIILGKKFKHRAKWFSCSC